MDNVLSEAARFVDHLDGTVTDRLTGLVWQKETAPGTYNWSNALAYCQSLTLAGSNWRLPTVQELQSIVDYKRKVPAIDPVFGAFSGWYWSSTSIAYLPDGAWYVAFDDGHVYGDDKGYDYYVRAVRSGP